MTLHRMTVALVTTLAMLSLGPAWSMPGTARERLRVHLEEFDLNQNRVADSLEVHWPQRGEQPLWILATESGVDAAAQTLNRCGIRGLTVTRKPIPLLQGSALHATSLDCVTRCEDVLWVEAAPLMELDMVFASRSTGLRRAWASPYAASQPSPFTLALLDSGIDASHPDLAGIPLTWTDLTGDRFDVDGDESFVPVDPYGHGTALASIAAGLGLQTSFFWSRTGVIPFPDGAGEGWRFPLRAFPASREVTAQVVLAAGAGSHALALGNALGIPSALLWSTQATITVAASFLSTSLGTHPSVRLTSGSDDGVDTAGTEHRFVVETFLDSVDAFPPLRGASPGNPLWVLRVADADGVVSAAAVWEALDLLLVQGEERQVVAALLPFSMSRGDRSLALELAMDALLDAGILPIAPSGNRQEDGFSPGSPGASPSVLTVGACNQDGQVSSFSTTSPGAPVAGKPDLVAMGGSLTSGIGILAADSNHGDCSYDSADPIVPIGCGEDAFANDYSTVFGTSVSAALTAGSVAWTAWALGAWSRGPSNSARRVKSALLMTASETISGESATPGMAGRGSPLWDGVEGYGRINADAALAALLRPLGQGTFVGNLGPTDQTAETWAGIFEMGEGSEGTATLTCPTGADFDLMVFSGEPNTNGEPGLIASATSTQPGAVETVTFDAPPGGDVVVVVKRISGSGAFQLVLAPPERCDGIDNDGDSRVDEGYPTLGTPCDGADLDQCPDGTVVCSADGLGVQCEDPGPALFELCNGLDDDCDGDADEGLLDCSADTCLLGHPKPLLISDFEESTSPWTLTVLAGTLQWHMDDHRPGQGFNSLYLGDLDQLSYDTGSRVAARAETPPIAFPDQAGLKLSFLLFMNTENNPGFDDLRVIADYGPDIEIWNSATDLGNETGGRFRRIQVDLGLLRNRTASIKFEFDSVDGVANDFEGVILDDVRIEVACCDSDEDCNRWDDECIAGSCSGGICELDALCSLCNPVEVSMLLLLDKSGSMEIHWDALREAVVTVASEHEDDVAFALKLFPEVTVWGQLDLPYYAGSADLDDAMAMITPGGSTPMGMALEAGRNLVQEFAPVGNRTILLFTDGIPDIPEDALQAIQSACAEHIPVFVVGFGQDVDPDFLDELALLGCAPRQGGPPFHYRAETTQELTQALAAIVGSISEETCNGLDDDCDGHVDESFGVGLPCDGGDPDDCPNGVVTCLADGSGAQCIESPESSEERCDGLDNDCNGWVDESFPELGRPCDGPDLDLCAHGVRLCSPDGSQTLCYPETVTNITERCNGLDDDCDGLTDEDFPLKGLPCDTEDGDMCANGTITCTPSQTETFCAAENPRGLVERCNSLDDDCDGLTDEDFPGLNFACDGLDGDACEFGLKVCSPDGVGAICWEEPSLMTERCNGLDDDCDGLTDEDFAFLNTPCDGPDPDSCPDGVLVCAGDERGLTCAVDVASDIQEQCNGLDDDCDGLTDEDFPLLNTPCDGHDFDLCAHGLMQCAPEGSGYVCGPETQENLTETCGDGQDNDCDGLVDEGCG